MSADEGGPIPITPLQDGALAMTLVDLWVEARGMNIRFMRLAGVLRQDDGPERQQQARELMAEAIEHDRVLQENLKVLFERIGLPWPT